MMVSWGIPSVVTVVWCRTAVTGGRPRRSRLVE
jgi:hypothetical protein